MSQSPKLLQKFINHLLNNHNLITIKPDTWTDNLYSDATLVMNSSMNNRDNINTLRGIVIIFKTTASNFKD